MRSHTRGGLLIVDGIAVALAIAAGLTVAAPSPASAAPDDDSVRAVLDRMNGSYNRSDFDAFAAHLCNTMLQAAGFKASWYQSRLSDGPTRITVNAVDVAGDDAVANVRFEAANRKDPTTLEIDFRRQGTEWKACRYHQGRSV